MMMQATASALLSVAGVANGMLVLVQKGGGTCLLKGKLVDEPVAPYKAPYTLRSFTSESRMSSAEGVTPAWHRHKLTCMAPLELTGCWTYQPAPGFLHLS